MKNIIILSALIIALKSHSQNRYSDGTSPTNMATGVYFQSGPGSNNSTYNWAYPYGTKLSVINGPNRNFEFTTTGYPNGNLSFRQWDVYNSTWETWRSIILSDANGNVGIGTSTPSEKLEVRSNDNNALYIGVNNSGGGSAGIKFGTSPSPYDKATFLYHQASNNTFYFNNSGDPNSKFSFITRNTSGNNVNALYINPEGYLGIGTTTPDSKLTVAGNIHTQEVKVTVNAGADFVFEEGYDLPSLQKLEQFIKTNKHLPEIASEKDMQENGLYLVEMNIKLLQKIEELTLYTIDQEKALKAQKAVNAELEEKLRQQESRIKKIELLLASKMNKKTENTVK
ncbi:hypothetical protein MHTCC0001_10210 [Flavobacteriaceae bacterium MHTCC 0001]